MQVLEQYGLNLGQAAATGAASYGISYILSANKVSNTSLMPVAKMAATSAASDLAAALASNQLLPTLAHMSSMDGATLKMYLGPVLSGAIYATISEPVGVDYRGFMEKFLYQAGASAAAGYLMAPAYYKHASQ